MDLNSNHFSYAGGSPRPLALPSDFCVEQVAATLEALAVEFERETRHGTSTAQGLAIASTVLRDRAAEALSGNLEIPANSVA